LTVNDFVLEHMVRGSRRAMPVVDDGRLVGIMSITDAKHLDQQAWATTRIGNVMTHTPLKTLGPDANLAAALQLMVENGVHQLPIMEDQALVGMVSRADVMRYLHAGPGVPERPTDEPHVIAAPAHGSVA
jgi:CBS domain-containing protein